MSSQGESSITSALRTGKRLKEFDSLFYMRDSIRRQYILDRYLKRLPKGDVKLNTAFQTRIEIGTDNGDDEDLREAYQRGWIDYQDILKYYKPSTEGVFPPNLLKRQDIIMGNLVKKTSLPKSTGIKLTQSLQERKKTNFDDIKEFEAFFESLEKKEKGRNTKSDLILLSKGFSKLAVGDKKEKNRFISMKKQLSNVKKTNIKLTNEPKKVVSKKIPMWKKEQIAENYKNERYKKAEEKRDAYFSRGRLSQGLSKEEKLKKVEEDLKFLGLSGLKRNILELKSREDKKRPAIFLGEQPNKSLKRKASVSSSGSSRKSSGSVYSPSTKSSAGSSRKSSVSGYSSPGSTQSEKELWSDSY